MFDDASILILIANSLQPVFKKQSCVLWWISTKKDRKNDYVGSTNSNADSLLLNSYRLF